MLCGHHIEMHHNRRGVYLYHCKYKEGDVDESGNVRGLANIRTECGLKVQKQRRKTTIIFFSVWCLLVIFVLLLYIVFGISKPNTRE